MVTKEAELVAKHTGLVRSIALRLSYAYREDVEDLMQIGYIGLLKAIRGFDESRGLAFSTYAVPMIAGEIKCQLRDHSAIKMSRSLKSDGARIRQAENDFLGKHGYSPHITDLAEMTGLTAERVTEALQASDALRNFENYEDVNLWVDEEEQEIARLDLAVCIAELQPRERQVIILRYYKDFTQQQIADMLGISQVQVSRIEKKVLRNLNKKIAVFEE